MTSESKSKIKKSKEGLPLSEYRWIHVSIAFLPALFVFVVFRVLAWTCRERSTSIEKLPPNTLLVGYNSEVWTSALCDQFWNQFDHPNAKFIWMGYHGFLSYISSAWPFLVGMHAFRYDRRKPQRPLHQILDFIGGLDASQVFGYRPDTGGPYSMVRGSVVKIAIETNRKFVGLRQMPSKYFRFKGQIFPLPFCKVESRLTDPIAPDQLKAWIDNEGRDYALAQVQKAMDECF